MRLKEKITKGIILLVLFFILVGCGGGRARTSDTFFSLDTVVTISIYDRGKGDAIQKASEMCDYYNSLFSKTEQGSDIYNINHAQGKRVRINKETYDLISRAIDFARLTKGKFDITIESVNALWNFKDNTGALPDKADIERELLNVDYTKIILQESNGEYYFCAPEGTKIDVGGIAKGYIGDKIANLLEELGVQNALLDLGGNIRVLGNRGGKGYKIGVKSPFDEKKVIRVFEVQATNVITSGLYERFVEVDGKKYHHILDTKTGYPIENDVVSATIVSIDGTMCDALSTICLILGVEEGSQLIRTIDTDAKGIFILNNGEIVEIK